MFHVWFIPALAVGLVVIALFYIVIARQKRTGWMRDDGRTVHHEDKDESDLPPGF